MRRARAVGTGAGAIALVALVAWSCASASIDPMPPAPTVTPAAIEAPPATDIFLLDIDPEPVPWKLHDVTRVTDRDGYDNQPCFEDGGRSLLFASNRDGQTDIYRYREGGADFEQLTATAESEYSPTPIPGWPGFSVVRVEADETQRLWRFPPSPGEGRGGELVFEAIAPVGYHAWADENTVALFVLGEPNRLVLGNLISQEAREVATGIGRSLHRVPGKNSVSFVDKSDPERWWITVLDPATGARRRLAETPAGSEDFIWWSPRELLIGDGSKLYLFDLDLAQYWREVADLSGYGISGITRLTRSPIADRLAVVGARPAP